MATPIYHLHTKHISRSSGQSVVAAVVYRCAERMRDERTGRIHDYTRRAGVEASFLILPPSANPGLTRAELWNRAEAAEKRKDARLAREVEIALPADLSSAQRQGVAGEFARLLSDRYGVAVDVALHKPGKGGDSRNYHAHLLMTTRKVEGCDLTEKSLFELSGRARAKLGMGHEKEQVEKIREDWARLCNRALELAGKEEKIDHRRLEAQRQEALEKGEFERAQELDREPTIKVGWRATQLERRGIETDRGEENRDIQARNQERQKRRKKQKERQGFVEWRGVVFEYRGDRCEGEAPVYRRTLDFLEKKEGRGCEDYLWGSGRRAFSDHGSKITYDTTTWQSLKAGVQLMKDKGWTEIHIWGGTAFQQEMWLIATVGGLKVTNYTPSERDIDRLAEMRGRQEAAKLLKEQQRKLSTPRLMAEPPPMYFEDAIIEMDRRIAISHQNAVRVYEELQALAYYEKTEAHFYYEAKREYLGARRYDAASEAGQSLDGECDRSEAKRVIEAIVKAKKLEQKQRRLAYETAIKRYEPWKRAEGHLLLLQKLAIEARKEKGFDMAIEMVIDGKTGRLLVKEPEKVEVVISELEHRRKLERDLVKDLNKKRGKGR